MTYFPWTQENCERLTQLWTVDGWSCGIIADEMGGGLTRNAVVGKLKRLNLLRRGFGPTRRYSTHPRSRTYAPRRATAPHVARPKKAKPSTKARKLNAPVTPLAPSPLNLTILQVTSYTCKYPFGEAAPYRFCGHPTVEGKPYCGFHCGIAFNGLPPKKRSEWRPRRQGRAG